MVGLHLPQPDRPATGVSEQGPTSRTLQAALWAVCGALLVLCLFFAVLGSIGPGEAKTATIVIAALGAIWFAHAWRRLWSTKNSSPRSDRERRGF